MAFDKFSGLVLLTLENCTNKRKTTTNGLRQVLQKATLKSAPLSVLH